MSCRPPTRPDPPRQAPPQVDGAIQAIAKGCTVSAPEKDCDLGEVDALLAMLVAHGQAATLDNLAIKRDFFVSFNKADRVWATWIAWVLEEAGHSVWFQDWD